MCSQRKVVKLISPQTAKMFTCTNCMIGLFMPRAFHNFRFFVILKKPIDYSYFTQHYLFQTPREPAESLNVVKQEFPVKQEKPDAVDNTSSISLADSQEAKKTNHSDTSDISGDEGSDARKEDVIDPKHDAQQADKGVPTSEAVETSIDGNVKMTHN